MKKTKLSDIILNTTVIFFFIKKKKKEFLFRWEFGKQFAKLNWNFLIKEIPLGSQHMFLRDIW